MLGGKFHVSFFYFSPLCGGNDINGVCIGVVEGPSNGHDLEFDMIDWEISIAGNVPEPGGSIIAASEYPGSVFTESCSVYITFLCEYMQQRLCSP